MASTSKSYDPSPERERFQRLKRGTPSSSERAASPSEASSCDEPGGKSSYHEPLLHKLSRPIAPLRDLHHVCPLTSIPS